MLYDFWIIIVPRVLGALALIALTIWAVRWARYAQMRGRYQAQKSRLAELERYRRDATEVLAAITVYRSLDQAPPQITDKLTNLLANQPNQ